MSNEKNVNFNFNFYAPVGQNIAHADKVEVHFDKDMSMQVVDTQAVIKDEVYNEENEKKNAASSRITDKQLAHAIEACSDFFWAQSSWGVIYCVCRDYLGLNYSMAEFERYVNDRLPFAAPPSYLCPEETISKAIRTSKYMELHIDKWEGNGAKERVLKLKEKLITELNQE